MGWVWGSTGGGAVRALIMGWLWGSTGGGAIALMVTKSKKGKRNDTDFISI